jgi:hypothetical protein
MIQFNLLPDVKQQYIKAIYRRRLITFICIVVAGTFLTIFVLMFLFVRVNQKAHMDNLNKDINTNVATLRKNPDLDKILTIQNQLNNLPKLHDDKVITSRIFEYLSQVTPASATVSDVEVDIENKKIVLKGTADTLLNVNKFVDTLKFTDFKLSGEESKEGKAFNSVVLQSFSIGTQSAGGSAPSEVTYQIDFVYDEAIFKNTAVDGSAIANSVKLTVPKIISTRSEVQKPSNLFQQAPTLAPTQGGN